MGLPTCEVCNSSTEIIEFAGWDMCRRCEFLARVKRINDLKSGMAKKELYTGDMKIGYAYYSFLIYRNVMDIRYKDMQEMHNSNEESAVVLFYERGSSPIQLKYLLDEDCFMGG